MPNPDCTPMKVCSKCGNEKSRTSEYFNLDRTRLDGFCHVCKDCRKALHKIYREQKDGREYQRQWRKNNSSYPREYYKNNPDKIKGYRQKHKSRNRVLKKNYKLRSQGLPTTFKPRDWAYALEYFHGCCAVCGRQLNDLFGEHTAAMDHWIPLTSPDCPGTVPTNIIPLCHGLGGCNNSKCNKDPEQWLLQKFGKHKAKKILDRIVEYFNSLEEA